MDGSTEPAGDAGDGPRRIGEVFVELDAVAGSPTIEHPVARVPED